MPEPSPRELRTWTTDGAAASTTCANPSLGAADDATVTAVGWASLSTSATTAIAIAAMHSRMSKPPAPARRLDLKLRDDIKDLRDRGSGSAAQRQISADGRRSAIGSADQAHARAC